MSIPQTWYVIRQGSDGTEYESHKVHTGFRDAEALFDATAPIPNESVWLWYSDAEQVRWLRWKGDAPVYIDTPSNREESRDNH
jgi:hypothetical protein